MWSQDKTARATGATRYVSKSALRAGLFASALLLGACASDDDSASDIDGQHADEHGALLAPYPGTPDIATPITKIDRYDPVLDSSRGPEIDPDKGYAVLDLGANAYFVTEGVYQVLFVRTANGLVLVDAPPTIGARLLAAAEEIAPGASITDLVYSHAHIDHIGFAAGIVEAFPDVRIVAHTETATKLARADDPNRPMPDEFVDVGPGDAPYLLSVGGETLEIAYPGPNHQDGNIEVWHPTSGTLMVVDVVFPGWMMWRRLALAEDIPGVFDLVASLNERYDFEHLVAGHVGRPGTKADVALQLEFMTDLHAAAGEALASVTPGEGVDPADFSNPWGLFDDYIDRVVVRCVAELAPVWRERMSGFDVFIYDQCLAMEQSLRVDGSSL